MKKPALIPMLAALALPWVSFCQAPPQAVLPEGHEVAVRMNRTVSSADAHVGDNVDFETLDDVNLGDLVVIPHGSTAMATVTEAVPKRRMARGGRLAMNIDYVRLPSGGRLALRGVQGGKGGGHTGAMTGAIVATSIVFFPAAPFFLFMHGKDITIPQGTEVMAFVEGDMHLDMANFVPALPPSAPYAQSAAIQASLVIDSTPPGADIEIDSTFVGNTPS